MNESKFNLWMFLKMKHYEGMHEEAIQRFKELQDDPDSPMFSLNEARIDVVRWASRIITLGNIKRALKEGEFE